MFLTTEIIHKDSSFLRVVENTCLTPMRYLFKGRTIEVLNGEVVKDIFSFEKRTFIRTAVAIATLIPGLILGISVSALNLLDRQYSQDKQLVKKFFETPLSLPMTPKGTFGEYNKSFCQHINAFMVRIKDDQAIWQEENFIQDVSNLMEEGYQNMTLYFQELSQKYNGDAYLIRDEMILQPQNRQSPSQDYCHPFFNFSIIYCYARGCAVRLDRQEWADTYGIDESEPMPIRASSALTEEQQEPYFNPTKPQYRWRQLFNAFCNLVDQNGLRTLLEERDGDERFSKWSCPDNHKAQYFDFPGTKPT